ncbi:MAG: bifunctional precorrin-2 dehydrogenase/sirohydrochlorin ferrochelatase [Acidimicrobiales bacterium]
MTEPSTSAGDHGYPDYPLVLRLTGLRSLVVGGGPVAARKVRGLVASGGRVRVVAPEMDPVILGLEEGARTEGGVGSEVGVRSEVGGGVELERRAYRAGEAADYDLVVAATGVPEVDRQVVSDATDGKALVNSVDRTAPGTVDLPAVYRNGPLTIAVSTGGASPALARWLRNRVAASIPAGVADLASLLDGARAAMRRAGLPTESVDWETLLDGTVGALVAAGQIDEARTVLHKACGLTDPG